MNIYSRTFRIMMVGFAFTVFTNSQILFAQDDVQPHHAIDQGVVNVTIMDLDDSLLNRMKEEKKAAEFDKVAVLETEKAPQKIAPSKKPPVKKSPKLSAEELGNIINLAGRQRMLSQKMTKEALFILAGIDVEVNKGNLKKSVNLFKKTLDGLRTGDSELGLNGTQDSKILEQIKKVEGIFAELEQLYLKVASGGSLSASEIDKISTSNLDLLSNSNEVVKTYQKDSGANANKEIDLAGRQRMLSQKMSKEILLIYLDINAKENMQQLYKTEKIFVDSLHGLEYGSDKLGLSAAPNQEILKQLQKVDHVWEFIGPAVDNIALMGKEGITSIDVTIVNAFNVPLLIESNKAVKLYEAVSH